MWPILNSSLQMPLPPRSTVGSGSSTHRLCIVPVVSYARLPLRRWVLGLLAGFFCMGGMAGIAVLHAQPVPPVAPLLPGESPLSGPASFAGPLFPTPFANSQALMHGLQQWLDPSVEAPPLPVWVQLRNAIASGNLDQVRSLLQRGALPNGGETSAETPLEIAIWYRQEDITRFLLAHGADPMLASGVLAASPLHLAVRQRDPLLARLLLEHGAKTNQAAPPQLGIPIEQQGDTALHEAAGLGDLAMLRLLFEFGANPLLGNRGGWVPMHRAVGNGHQDAAELLLQAGAELEQPNRIGITPLHWAVSKGQVDTVTWLLQKGANVNALSRNGISALHSAVARRHAEMVNLLLQHGADTTARSGQGETPLEMSYRLGYRDLIARLESARQPKDPS